MGSRKKTDLYCRHIVIYYLALAIWPTSSISGYGGHWVRLPRRLYQHPKWKTRHAQESSSSLSVEPRAFQVDHLPSTPQLNALMDRAMGKVKSMVKELENEKGSKDDFVIVDTWEHFSFTS